MKHALLLVAALMMITGCDEQGDAAPFPEVPLVEVPSGQTSASRVDALIDRLAGAEPTINNHLQNIIATCMAGSGFTYVPLLVSDDYRSPKLLGDQAYRRQHGYGLSEDNMIRAMEHEDPNDAIRKSLSPSALSLYEVALFGKDEMRATITDAQGRETGTFPGAGCVAKSYKDVYGTDQGRLQADLDYLGVAQGELQQKIESDDRWVSAWHDWSSCMAGLGYDVKTRSAARDLVAGTLDPSGYIDPQYEARVVAADNSCSEQLNTDAAVNRLIYSYEEVFLGIEAQRLGIYGRLLSDSP